MEVNDVSEEPAASIFRIWAVPWSEFLCNIGKYEALPHTAVRKQAVLSEFGWEVFKYPVSSPDLAISDFPLCPTPREFLSGRRFKSDEEVKEAVKEWLNGLAA